jgi:hypothetical protein
MWRYILITPIEGKTALERAQDISGELFAITRPAHLREGSDLSNMIFPIIEQGGNVYLQIILDYIITVHPENDVEPLAALFPHLSEAEKNGLVHVIKNSNSFAFQNIIPAGTIIYEEI